MLEIFLVWALAKKIGNIVQNKGHTRWGYQLLLVVLWIGGEVMGGIVGAIVQEGGDQGESGFPLMAYVCALVGAAIGAGIAFAIATSLANVKTDADYYQDDDYDRRRDGMKSVARLARKPEKIDRRTPTPTRNARPGARLTTGFRSERRLRSSRFQANALEPFLPKLEKSPVARPAPSIHSVDSSSPRGWVYFRQVAG